MIRFFFHNFCLMSAFESTHEFVHKHSARVKKSERRGRKAYMVKTNYTSSCFAWFLYDIIMVYKCITKYMRVWDCVKSIAFCWRHCYPFDDNFFHTYRVEPCRARPRTQQMRSRLTRKGRRMHTHTHKYLTITVKNSIESDRCVGWREREMAWSILLCKLCNVWVI